MPTSAVSANQAMLRWPFGRTMKAASSGPIADPALPPTWKSDCAKPCRPPEAMPRHARRLGVEDRRADADARHGDEHDARTTARTTSSTSPTSVNAMPMASEYGFGAVSVK